MNIYIVRKMVITSEDQLVGALIFALTEEQARNMKPRRKCSSPYDRWEDDVVIEKIGVCSDEDAHSSVQMTSLNFMYRKPKVG